MLKVYEILYKERKTGEATTRHIIKKDDWSDGFCYNWLYTEDEYQFISYKTLSGPDLKDFIWNSGHSASRVELPLFLGALEEGLKAVGFKPITTKSINSWFKMLFPCGGYFIEIRKSNHTEIVFGLTESHPEYEVAKKYGGKTVFRIGYWFSRNSTIEASNEYNSIKEIYDAIVEQYRLVKKGDTDE